MSILTPYAQLMVKPSDADEVIRDAYRELARANHPDKEGADAEPGAGWYPATAAYTAIKTKERREAWARERALLSGLCADCDGSGVRGTRMFKGKVRLCGTCHGSGRKS